MPSKSSYKDKYGSSSGRNIGCGIIFNQHTRYTPSGKPGAASFSHLLNEVYSVPKYTVYKASTPELVIETDEEVPFNEE